MKISNIISFGTLFFLTFVAPATADTLKVIQKDKKFYMADPKDDSKLKKIKKLTIKEGDIIKFYNEDSITHNVYSKSDIANFEIKKHAQGEEHEHKFDAKGTAKVRCAIHPKMKLKVTVE